MKVIADVLVYCDTGDAKEAKSLQDDIDKRFKDGFIIVNTFGIGNTLVMIFGKGEDDIPTPFVPEKQ